MPSKFSNNLIKIKPKLNQSGLIYQIRKILRKLQGKIKYSQENPDDKFIYLTSY